MLSIYYGYEYQFEIQIACCLCVYPCNGTGSHGRLIRNWLYHMECHTKLSHSHSAYNMNDRGIYMFSISYMCLWKCICFVSCQSDYVTNLWSSGYQQVNHLAAIFRSWHMFPVSSGTLVRLCWPDWAMGKYEWLHVISMDLIFQVLWNILCD